MSQWWAKWGAVTTRLVTMSASVAALLGMALPHVPRFSDLPNWGVALIVVSVVAFIAFVVLEIRTGRNHRVYREDDAEGIRKYMHDWIEHGGRVAIWTRDMSWANNSETKRLLRTKAKARELIICLPVESDLTSDLREHGAEIYPYGRADHAPASRFTITYFERDGSRVAVGRARKGWHLIDEFGSGEHPAFFIAEDLVKLAQAANPRG